MNKTKLCPFRPYTVFMAGTKEKQWNTTLDKADYTKTLFDYCYKEKCIMWNNLKHNCKMTNKGE